MTLPSNLNKHTYIGNGLQTAWPFTFPIFSSSDIKVYLTNVSSEVVEEVTSNYTVDIDNSQVTYPVSGTALTSEYKITLLRVVGITQETSLINQGAFLPKVIEKALDKLTAISQQLDEEMERSVKVAIGSSTAPDELIAELKADVASAATSAASASNSAVVAAEVLSETQAVAQTVADDTVEAASAQLQGYVDTAETAKNEAANSANEAKTAAESVQSYIGHVSDTDNPHETTAAQVGSYTKEETNAAIENALSVPAVPGLTNYIASGLNVHAGAGLQVIVDSGRAAIAEKSLDIPAEIPVSLSARMASLLYLKGDKTVGKIDAALPPVDAYTVARWEFSNWDGVSPIPNSAVGVNGNTIAVANALTKSGTVNRVDGYVGYAAQGDGSTGYLVSANSAGFPAASQEKEIDIVFMPKTLSGTRIIANYGGASTAMYTFYTIGTRLNISDGNTAIDTNFDFEAGKTYLFSILGSPTNIYYFYINGSLVYTSTAYFTGSTVGAMYLSRSVFAGTGYNDCTFQYVQIRNKMRSPAELGAIANALLFPYQYQAPAGSYPTILAADQAMAWHEWRFDETSGTAVADSAGTANGTAVGTTIVDSEIGKARKFTGVQSDVINVGSWTWAAYHTVIAKYTPLNLNNPYPSLLGNFNGSSGGIYSISNDGGGKMAVYNGAWSIFTNLSPQVGVSNFAAFSVGGGSITGYTSPMNFQTLAFTPNTAVTANLEIGDGGATGVTNNCFNGTIDYLLYIPRALSQYEISLIYDALMHTTTKDIRSILPADDIVCAKVRTGSAGVLEIDKTYGIGRREGAVGGNRRVFLGFKYFSGATTIKWENPFGTRKIETYFTYALDAIGTGECKMMGEFNDGGVEYGLRNYGDSSGKIIAYVGAKAIIVNNVWQTSGFIGCYAEVIE